MKENKLPISRKAVSVRVETGLAIVEADEFGFLTGETLAQRANRLDSELESSRGDLGAKGEPGI
jgi:hypothetical protein